MSATYAEVNRQLIILLGVSFIGLTVVSVIVAVVATRAITRSIERLSERYETLHREAVIDFLRTQREENARLVADTRAATAKMNVMADALWDGLNTTVRGRPE